MHVIHEQVRVLSDAYRLPALGFKPKTFQLAVKHPNYYTIMCTKKHMQIYIHTPPTQPFVVATHWETEAAL